MSIRAQSRGLAVIASLSLGSILLSAPSHAALPTFPTGVPLIKLSVSKTAIDFGDVPVGSGATESFRITNDTACAMHLDLGSDVSNDFVTTCSGLTSTDEIPAGSDIGCSVRFSPRTPMAQSKVLSVKLSYGVTCKSALHAGLNAHHDELKKPVSEKRDALEKAGPDTVIVDTALKLELLRIATATDKLKTEDLELKNDSPEILRDLKEYQRLGVALKERISTLNEQWDRLKEKGPNLEVVTNLASVKTAKFKLEDSRLETAIAAKRAEQKLLAEQLLVALAELRKGRCKACSMTKSEYERSSKVRSQSWDDHIDEHGMRPATAEDLAAKKKEYDDKIAAAGAAATELDTKRTGLKKQHDADLAELNTKTKAIEDAHAKRLDEIHAQISSVRKDMRARISAIDARIHELRDKAAKRQAAIKKEIKALETAKGIATADHRAKVGKIKTDHATALAKLDSEIASIKTQLTLAQSVLNRNLTATKTAHVKLTGKGVKP